MRRVQGLEWNIKSGLGCKFSGVSTAEGSVFSSGLGGALRSEIRDSYASAYDPYDKLRLSDKQDSDVPRPLPLP